MKKLLLIVVASSLNSIAFANQPTEVQRFRQLVAQVDASPTATPRSTAVGARPTSTPAATTTTASTPSSTLTAEEKAAAEGVGRFLLFVIGTVLFIACWLWLLPGIIASKRKHPNAGSIWLVTIFLGWSVFGWLGALVWACGQKD